VSQILESSDLVLESDILPPTPQPLLCERAAERVRVKSLRVQGGSGQDFSNSSGCVAVQICGCGNRHKILNRKGLYNTHMCHKIWYLDNYQLNNYQTDNCQLAQLPTRTTVNWSNYQPDNRICEALLYTSPVSSLYPSTVFSVYAKSKLHDYSIPYALPGS